MKRNDYPNSEADGNTSIFGNRYLRTPNSEVVDAKESALYLAGSAAAIFLIELCFLGMLLC